ncbi:facilitated trehalose transporter Tret1-like [Oratosquilla oratoria]|uniref:facilitated trehalose transporter Tret1-like n=1 Tax=Oratosquilla oratoria TaxID=337810 RepID=UPI003F75BA90
MGVWHVTLILILLAGSPLQEATLNGGDEGPQSSWLGEVFGVGREGVCMGDCLEGPWGLTLAFLPVQSPGKNTWNVLNSNNIPNVTADIVASNQPENVHPATVFYINVDKCDEEKQNRNSHSEETKKTTTQRPALGIQVLAGLVVALAQLASGCATTYAGATIPRLTDKNSTDLYLDEYNVSLFASLVNVGSLVGSISCGFLMVELGPRVATLVTLPAWLCAWIMIYFVNSVKLLHFAIFLLGTTKGVLENTPYTYMAEIAYMKYRGALSGVVDVCRALGMMFMYGIGALSLTWRQLALVVGISTSVPTFIGLLFLHDSPRWLANRGRFEETAKSLQFFRGSHYNIDEEYKDICDHVRERSIGSSIMHQLVYLKDVSILKRVGLLSAMVFLIQWGGNIVILSYTTVIFDEADSCDNNNVCSISVGAGRTLGALFFMLLVDYLGRRVAFIGPTLCSALCTLSLGVFFYVKNMVENGEELVSYVSWLPLVAVVIFSFNMAWVLAVFSILSGEILPGTFRQMGRAITGSANALSKTGAAQSFPNMKNTFGYHTVFWFCAFCGTASAVIPLLILETSGKSLEEIDRHYTRKQNKK